MAESSTPPGSGRPAVFFDRDGVVNQSPGAGYVLDWEAFEFAPGLFDLVALVKEAGWEAIVVTSQKGVGKGLMSAATLEAIHDRMQATLEGATGGHRFDAIYAYTGTPVCPHQPKPDPEMILTAARERDLDLAHSWMIGDADRDIAMAIAAGLAGTVRVHGDKPIGVEATHTVSDLAVAKAVFEQVILGTDSQA